jgi:chemotaxis protein MotB
MRKITSISIIACIITMMSCGTQKKLEQTTADLNKARELSEQQAQKISTYEADIAKLKEENIVHAKEAENCRLLEERLRKNLEALNDALAEHGTSIRKIYNKVETSMAKFAEAGIEVSFKNGLVFISMEDQLVFNSGSSTVGWEGKQALALVAEELNQYPGVTVYVLGNTDDQKTKPGAKDNWSLSTERANAIVRVLRDEYKVDPARMISGGRAMYHPIADNATPEGRAKNRRTDIVINPNLDRIWEMTEKK